MKTIMPKQISTTDRKWYVIDAKGQTLGKVATKIAPILKGKNKVDYAPHVDNGDYIIVLNADKITVTGNKTTDKMYHRHTGYLG
jgi:large subunit ribosomal protein L13